jgi:hypothetical protein
MGHPFYVKGYGGKAISSISVHGGITYADKCVEGGNIENSICHLDNKSEPVWWFGFDCAHAYDLLPKLDADLSAVSSKSNYSKYYASHHDVYRNIEYVKAEIKNLAEQLELLGAASK